LRKKKTSLQWDIPSVKLYMDDLEKILEELRPLQESSAPEISDGTYEYESLEEAANQNIKRIDTLTIRLTRVGFELRLGWGSSFLYYGGDDPVGEAAFYKIKELLKAHRKVGNYLFPRPLVPLFYPSLLVLVVVSLFGTMVPNLVGSVVAILTILAAVASLVARLYSEAFFTSIIPTDRRLEVSFWQRKEDELILVLIAGGVGIVVTLLGQWLYNRFFLTH